MLPVQAAIFDLDGVIVDTAKYHYLAWKRLASELGFEFSAEHNERLKGVSRIRSLEIVLEIGGITATESQKTEWAIRKNNWYLEYICRIRPAEILPGVVALINHLRSQGLKIALGSASKNAPLILENLGINPLFDVIIDGNQVSKAKPDPEVFLTAARELNILPAHCVVFEDAAAGIEAARNAGMLSVGIGDAQILRQADLVIRDMSKLDCTLFTGEAPDEEWLLLEKAFSRGNTELNGSKFLLGNGYMGYRGTLEEYSKDEQVACTLAGIFDRMGGAWREPVNAPNGLYTLLYCDNQPLHTTVLPPENHFQCLDMQKALHQRESHFKVGQKKVQIKAERFLSLDNVHLVLMKYSFRCEESCQIKILTGIDGDVWDINGPHYRDIHFSQQEQYITAAAITNEGERVVVTELLDCTFGVEEKTSTETALLHQVTVQAEPGREYCFYKYVSIYTSKDTVDQLEKTAVDKTREAWNTGYDRLYLRHVQLWHQRWLMSDVVIEGDDEAQFALRYSIYQLLAVAPAHSDRLSIPARGLSGQIYKGAVFWDTEMFMLPFFHFTQPQLAKNILKYRYRTLDGARKKAAEYGYRGAFYAWESHENGNDACTLFNVTDVFTGRPMRTYFRDKQIHISADVVYGIWQYYQITGDESILFEGGAEVILECARFFVSYAYFKKDKQRFEILDVTGPDEYHERVSNNAFTNYMIKYSLEAALQVLKLLQQKNEPFYRNLLLKLDFEKEIPAITEMYELLYIPAPAADTLIIEQFDGYLQLEDVSLTEIQNRVKSPNEYWGGGNGLATGTRIIKQADVVLLLNLLKKQFTAGVKKANWEYYEPRTEHGSSLSPCVYAMLATDIDKPDWAYPYFQKTATIDLRGDYKRYVGTLYIGGTHPAANGGAWMAAILGFGGLHFDGEVVSLAPQLPAKWRSLNFQIAVKGQVFEVKITAAQITVKAAVENTQTIRWAVAGKIHACNSGEELSVPRN
jgi:nigerose phosphorylase